MCFAQELAGDAYCGRLLTGLPVNLLEFAMYHPDFVPDLVGDMIQRMKRLE